MKRVIVLMLLLSIIATPLYAINIFDKVKCREAKIGKEKVLVNRFTGKVEKKMVNDNYEKISSERGFGGIPSEQDMYQARYDRKKN